eukprot:JP436414.1.p1 GENE.JP436414.1~~JP436414.1.p1  ORF type:complete len:201 (+),score=6.15 JP436414.1:149-751(+)
MCSGSPHVFRTNTCVQDHTMPSGPPHAFKITTCLQDHHMSSRSPHAFKITTCLQGHHMFSRSPHAFKPHHAFKTTPGVQDHHMRSGPPHAFKKRLQGSRDDMQDGSISVFQWGRKRRRRNGSTETGEQRMGPASQPASRGSRDDSTTEQPTRVVQYAREKRDGAEAGESDRTAETIKWSTPGEGDKVQDNHVACSVTEPH